MARFPNPLIDTIFKIIFGQEGKSEEFLIDFLNQVFIDDPDIGEIVEIRYGNTERIEDSPLHKKIIFDIYCETSTGHKFIVEMQKANQYNFSKRMLYYLSRLITDQVKQIRQEFKDSNYLIKKKSDFDYMPVVGVFICDFVNKELPGRTLVKEGICDKETGEVTNRDMRTAIIQLPFFKKSQEECETGFDKWIYVLKNMDKLETLPFVEYRDRLFERLGKMAEYSALTEEEQAQYDADVKWASDYNETVLFRYDQGLKEGEARGRAEGEARGRAEGEAKGRAEGIEQGKWEDAEGFFKAGVSLETISNVTKIPIDELKRRLN